MLYLKSIGQFNANKKYIRSVVLLAIYEAIDANLQLFHTSFVSASNASSVAYFGRNIFEPLKGRAE